MSADDMDIRVAHIEEQVGQNTKEIGAIKDDISDIKKDQKAIYDLNTSVQLMVQQMGHMAEKLDDTNSDVKTLNKEMSSVKSQLAEVDVKSDRQVAKNWNQIKVAIITAVCTLIATGAVAALITFIK